MSKVILDGSIEKERMVLPVGVHAEGKHKYKVTIERGVPRGVLLRIGGAESTANDELSYRAMNLHLNAN